MEIYLDNAATTEVYPEVVALMTEIMRNDYGNPSSMHRKGVEAERYLKTAAAQIAAVLKTEEKNIYFTSGGTESNNWALKGAAFANRRAGMHIITTPIEHAAVSEPLRYLEGQGFEITKVPVDCTGTVNPEDIKNAVRGDTILVSVMAVNNEIGSVQPVAEIGHAIKEANPRTLFHVDAIQAFAKLPICPSRDKIDMLSASGHKIHGPKGSGILYIGKGVKSDPLILGGGQQKGYRSGTDNVPGAAGMALAAQMMAGRMQENRDHMMMLRERLIKNLSEMENVVIHGQTLPEGAPHIVNASFCGVRSEVLLHSLEEKEIYVSSGSACSSHKRAGSPTLTACGCSKAEMESSVRFSFCETTRPEDIDQTAEAIGELLPLLRKYSRH